MADVKLLRKAGDGCVGGGGVRDVATSAVLPARSPPTPGNSPPSSISPLETKPALRTHVGLQDSRLQSVPS